MIYLVLGSPDSGKSKRAEDKTLELSKEGRRYYIATMIPFGEEGENRIKKHRSLREGKGFITIERPFDVDKTVFPNEACEEDIKKSTVLLECISNLVANELFERKTDPLLIPKMVADQVLFLSQRVENLLVVTNRFPLEGEGYDEDTLTYVNTIDAVNKELIKLADEVEEIGNEHI